TGAFLRAGLGAGALVRLITSSLLTEKPPPCEVVFLWERDKRFPLQPLSILTPYFNQATFRRGGLC
ncbi:hypothetical protein, partial [Aeromonas piscicola]|uniref:hypothetical protein n=1 Tax=Aeromonas piscicola TaxID=600645 RepID=UPI0028E2CB2C